MIKSFLQYSVILFCENIIVIIYNSKDSIMIMFLYNFIDIMSAYVLYFQICTIAPGSGSRLLHHIACSGRCLTVPCPTLPPLSTTQSPTPARVPPGVMCLTTWMSLPSQTTCLPHLSTWSLPPLTTCLHCLRHPPHQRVALLPGVRHLSAL